MMKFLNPKVKDYLKENEDKTLIGLWFGMYFRLLFFIFAITIGFTLLVTILG